MQPKIQCVKTGQLSQTNSLECGVSPLSTLSESENVTIAYAGIAYTPNIGKVIHMSCFSYSLVRQ